MRTKTRWFTGSCAAALLAAFPAVSAASRPGSVPPGDAWRQAPTLNDALDHHSQAVWTGTTLLTWGPRFGGNRYDPATDSWTPMAVGPSCPSERDRFSAVWTGSEMIVWGGGWPNVHIMSTGGRYDPATDTWRPTSTGPGCPSPRAEHTAAWTGDEMIVWGGMGDWYLDSGGRYDPATDSWRPTSSAGAPTPRTAHAAVWTGTQMIVWGGSTGYPDVVQTGGRYDPLTDSWQATSTGAGCPSAREHHSAVWTGTEMIVWGGGLHAQTGGRYDPVTDSWRATSTAATCPEGRDLHTAIWTGSRMVVWGGSGSDGLLHTGGVYDPVADAWTPTSTATGCPSVRWRALAAWTGSEMIVWGGEGSDWLSTGGRYDPKSDSWRSMSSGPPHPVGVGFLGVWTGSELLVLGAGTGSMGRGARYDPTADSWRPMAPGGDPGRYAHTVVWTGLEMIVWGGRYTQHLDTGARYDPGLDAWRPTSTGSGCPSARADHSAVWTGSEMIVWGGGDDDVATATGGRYDPSLDRWKPVGAGAPSPRVFHTAVWSGREMIVWGGSDSWRLPRNLLATGGRYDPATDTWSLTSTATACPTARMSHTAVWSGTEMIVWGGNDASNASTDTGARYDPVADSWLGTSTVGSPSLRALHTAVWTGSEMIVWGGSRTWYSGLQQTGGRYTPASDRWTATATGPHTAVPREGHVAVWTGASMIVWGGTMPDRYGNWTGTGTGGIYDPGTTSDPSPLDDHLLGRGLGDGNPNQVAVYRSDGSPAGVDFLAYGAGSWGTTIAAGDIDGVLPEEILTGPGPGMTLGPQARGWEHDGTPLAKVNFYAYGTLRYGVNVAGGSMDGDASSQILTGAGPGEVFGPHVRGWRFDGTAARATVGINFFAYATLRFGVNPAAGHVAGDAREEILTGPGPGIVFSPHVRGFTYDGGVVEPLVSVSFLAFDGARHGCNVASGDVDEDGVDEILAATGPGPSLPSRLAGFEVDGDDVVALEGFDVTPFTTLYGARVGAGDVAAVAGRETLAGAGRDPAATSSVLAFTYDGTTLLRVNGVFTPFPGGYGVNVDGAALAGP